MRAVRLVPISIMLVVAGCSTTPGTPTGSSASLSSASAASPDGGADFTPPSATLIFASNGSYGASVPLVAEDLVGVSYDASRAAACAQLTRDGEPVWATVAYYTYAGGPTKSLVIAGSGAGNGPPTFSLPGGAGGDLAVWFETTNDAGCASWDSNYGQNFHFLVAAHGNAAPSWIGNADSVLTRASCADDDSQCDADRHALELGFSFDTQVRSDADYTRVEFQVWQAGVTDFDNGNLWKELDVELHWRVGGSGAYATSYVSFDRRLGNNARYTVDLRALDPLPTPIGGPLTDASQCPTFATTVSSDGQYIQANVDFWFTVNGLELRPPSGLGYLGTYAQYAGLYAICAAH